MNKEAELPKSIDFSQLPEAPRAFKAGEDTHTYRGMGTHVRTLYTDTHTDRERFKSERIMAPAVAVSLKTQFALSRFPTGHRSPDKRTHSEPAGFCSPSVIPAVMHSTFCTMPATLKHPLQRSNICVCTGFLSPPGSHRKRNNLSKKPS